MDKRRYERDMDTMMREEVARVEMVIKQIEKAEARGEEMGGGNDKVNELRAKQKKAQEKLSQLKSADEDNWEHIKPELENALTELKDAVNEAISAF